MPNKVNGWEAFRDRANIDSIALMPGEDHEDFENLLRDHYEEFTPDGTTEEYLTIEIAKLRWERDRLDRSLQLEMSVRRSELMVEHELAHEFREAKSRAAEFQQTNSVEDVEKLLSQLGDMIGGLVRKWPHGSGDQPESWGSVIANDKFNSGDPGRPRADKAAGFCSSSTESRCLLAPIQIRTASRQTRPASPAPRSSRRASTHHRLGFQIRWRRARQRRSCYAHGRRQEGRRKSNRAHLSSRQVLTR
jgi:hypothetical protein